MLIVLNAVLIPLPASVGVLLFLLEYPDPLLITLILSTTYFFWTDLKLCFPTPCVVKDIVLIPTSAFASVECSLIVVLFTLAIKYCEKVVIPPIGSCPLVS